jgi:hypothetical protein
LDNGKESGVNNNNNNISALHLRSNERGLPGGGVKTCRDKEKNGEVKSAWR